MVKPAIIKETNQRKKMSELDSQDPDNQPKVEEPPPDGKRIFLSHCNSYEGQALFKALWNKHEFDEKPEWIHGAHTFVGTCRKEERNARGGYEEPPVGIESFVDFERT